MSKTAGKKQEYRQLKNEFTTAFDWKSVSYPAFASYVHKESGGEESVSKHSWGPLHRGEPVPAWVINRFSEYVSERANSRYPASAISEIVPEDSRVDDESPPNARRAGRHKLFEFFADRFAPPQLSYLHGDEDFDLAARIVLEEIGRSNTEESPSRKRGPKAKGMDPTMSPDLAIKRGCKLAAVGDVDEFAGILHTFHRASEVAILFAVWSKRSIPYRIGVSSVVPLREKSYERFRAGEIADKDIGSEDIEMPTKYLMVHALADYANPDLDKRIMPLTRMICQSKTINWQLAYFLHPLEQINPSLVSFAGTEETEKVLRSYNFSRVGTRMRESDKAIMELSLPQAIPSREYYYYLGMKAMLSWFQANIAAQQYLSM